MADEIIEALRKNDPECTEIAITLRHFRDANTLRWLVQALKMNRHVTKLCFLFDDDDSKRLDDQEVDEDEDDDKPLSIEHWKPFLEAIETHRIVDAVQIHNRHYMGQSLLPLYCDMLFPAIEKNKNIKTLRLDQVDFSKHADGIVNHLETSLNLQELALFECCDSKGTGNAARVLQQNIHLRSLFLELCSENLVCPVLYGLASPGSASKLKTIAYRPEFDDGPSVLLALRLYLASPSATIRCFELRDCDIELSTILQGVARNSLLENVTFENCRVNEESAYLLASCILTKPNLSTLRLWDCNFGMFHPFLEAMVEILTRVDSTLRHFEIVADMAGFISRKGFETLLIAIAESTRLEHLEIGSFDDSPDDPDGDPLVEDDELPYLQCFLQVMPMLKLKTLQVFYASSYSLAS